MKTEITPIIRDFRLFLREELLSRCRNNPHYSLRAFARALELDPSVLSKLLRGKRKMGPRTVKRLGSRLGLDAEVLNAFIQEGNGGEEPDGCSTEDFHNLSYDVFRVISDWHHYAILELMRVDGFRPQSGWIARALGIEVATVNSAIRRLERLHMIEITENGSWRDLTSGKTTTIGNKYSASALRNHQYQVLRKAIEALENIPFERRDQSSMTIATDSSRIDEAKLRIKSFRRQLARFLGQGDKRDQVYNICISLYPLTQIKERK